MFPGVLANVHTNMLPKVSHTRFISNICLLMKKKTNKEQHTLMEENYSPLRLAMPCGQGTVRQLLSHKKGRLKGCEYNWSHLFPLILNFWAVVLAPNNYLYVISRPLLLQRSISRKVSTYWESILQFLSWPTGLNFSWKAEKVISLQTAEPSGPQLSHYFFIQSANTKVLQILHLISVRQ